MKLETKAMIVLLKIDKIAYNYENILRVVVFYLCPTNLITYHSTNMKSFEW